MILHCVMLNLRPDHDPDELASVMAGLATLEGQIDGFKGFAHGLNVDAEGKSPNHPYGFICRFENRAALGLYAADPRHQALGGRLVALCDGGADGIVVYDLDTETRP